MLIDTFSFNTQHGLALFELLLPYMFDTLNGKDIKQVEASSI